MSEEKKPKRRQKHEDHDDGHPLAHDESNWLVSYADMMTLLFGFFVILYSISKVDQDKYTIVAKDLAKYFGGKVESVSIQNIVQQQIQGVLQNSLPQGSYQVASIPTGVSIKFNSNILFAPGSAKLNPDMYPVLSKLIETLTPYKVIDEIRFEGHTDDEPIQSIFFPTNWELSSARANRILRQFESSGFKSEKLIAEAFGSSRPEKPNRDQNGQAIPANQKDNRRVVINLLMSTKNSKEVNKLIEKDFKVKTNPQEVSEADNKEEAPVDTEETLRNRMQLAQDKLKNVNLKIKELQMKQKKKQQVLELEKKVKELEDKAKEAEGQIK